MKNTEFRIQNTEFRVQDTEFRVQDTEFSIQNTVYRVQGSEQLEFVSVLPDNDVNWFSVFCFLNSVICCL